MAGEVGGIKATGKTAFGQKAISMEDVEQALGDLLAKHGVLTGYHWNNEPKVVGNEAKSTLWMADITAWLANADDPTDTRSDRLFDVGTSPSAAVSFALKRYYKALFHLADEEDEKRSTPRDFQPRSEVVPFANTARVGKQGDGVGTAPSSTTAISLTREQKTVLSHMGNSLEKPWPAERYAFELNRMGGFLPVRDLLIGLHRQDHGEHCTHFAEAVVLSPRDAAEPVGGPKVA